MNQNKELNKSLKLIVKSSLFVFFGVLSSKIISYIYRILIARYFGPEIYGLFSLSIIILLWFVTFSSLGLYEGLLRFIPLYRGKKEANKIRYIFKLSIIILLFLSIIAGILLFLLSKTIAIIIFHDSNLIIFLQIFSFIMPFYVLGYAFLTIIQAYEKIKIHPFISDFLPNFVKLIFLILFIFIGIKTNAIIFSYCLGILAIFLASYFYCKFKISEIFKKIILKEKLKKQIKKELFSYSWPLIFLGLLTNIFIYIDSIALGYFKTPLEVGLYNAIVPLAELMILFPDFITRFFLPLITREFSKKKLEIVRELSKQVEKWILIINLPLCVLLFLFSSVFINLLFGTEYIQASIALKFLAISYLFTSLSFILCALINMIGKSKIILINTIFFSILNLILNIILIPKYGINGAAIATMMSNIILSLILFLQVKKYTTIIPLKRKMFKVFLSIIIPTLLLVYIKKFIVPSLLTIIISGSFFILIYFILIFITKSLDKNDIIILKGIREKIIFYKSKLYKK